MNILNLRRKAQFYAEAPAWCLVVWPRKESLDHFVKQHRDELQAAGALRKIGRDHFLSMSCSPDLPHGFSALRGR